MRMRRHDACNMGGAACDAGTTSRDCLVMLACVVINRLGSMYALFCHRSTKNDNVHTHRMPIVAWVQGKKHNSAQHHGKRPASPQSTVVACFR
jgi:hypothetical protein